MLTVRGSMLDDFYQAGIWIKLIIVVLIHLNLDL